MLWIWGNSKLRASSGCQATPDCVCSNLTNLQGHLHFLPGPGDTPASSSCPPRAPTLPRPSALRSHKARLQAGPPAPCFHPVQTLLPQAWSDLLGT